MQHRHRHVDDLLQAVTSDAGLVGGIAQRGEDQRLDFIGQAQDFAVANLEVIRRQVLSKWLEDQAHGQLIIDPPSIKPIDREHFVVIQIR